ncbi:MAG: hypothetical protein JWM33_762, partial [Caulobacteraceae bacterium]|nr:hypothetical protein [Caulobacteraceae bacterium]
MLSSSPALRTVVEALEVAFGRFPDMWNEGATLAFSGGKDSIALASALELSGRKPQLRAVDMGYSQAWRGRIEQLAESLRLSVQILTVADIVRNEEAEPAIRRELAIRRAFLDDDGASKQAVSPCTNCYNCKILSLVDAARRDSPNILFAHHADDALSSFLKSGLMYLDRWRDGNESFDRERFRSLGLQLAAD